MMNPARYLLLAIAHLQIIPLCMSQGFVGERCSGAEGRMGVCQLIRNCPGAEDDIKRRVRPIHCGFERRDPIVCCTASMPQPITSRVPGETAKKWCIEYLKLCTDGYGGAGGAGGVPALPGEFPHMAAIGYGDERDIAWNCGGTLISDKFVLTAAHCLSTKETGPARWVLLGTLLLINTTATDGKNGQIHPITRRIRHPEYKPPAKYHDIALLEIGSAVTPNPRPLNLRDLHPACLPTKSALSGVELIATGWGRVGHGEDGSSNLLKIRLDVFELSLCQKTYEVEIRHTNKLRRGIVNTMLCAGVLEGKRDTCEGDSGGPLQYSFDYDCSYEVLGVTSFGKVCAFPNSPSIYSNVFEYVPWIEDIVWPI